MYLYCSAAVPDQRPRDVFCQNNKQALSGVSLHRTPLTDTNRIHSFAFQSTQ